MEGRMLTTPPSFVRHGGGGAGETLPHPPPCALAPVSWGLPPICSMLPSKGPLSPQGIVTALPGGSPDTS